LAIALNMLTKVMKSQPPEPAVRQMSGVSMIVLSTVLVLIIGGLGWCFYKAITAAATEKTIELQSPEEE